MTTSLQTRLGYAPEEGMKAPVVCATDANITLSGIQTIDSYATESGDRVLVKSQTDSAENGIYIVSNTSWERASDFNDNNDIVNGVVIADANTGYYYAVVLEDDTYTPGTSEITFTTSNISGGLTGADIVDNLDSTDSDKVLSANMGNYLGGGLDHLMGFDDAQDARDNADSANYQRLYIGSLMYMFSATRTETDDGYKVLNQTGNVGAGRWVLANGVVVADVDVTGNTDSLQAYKDASKAAGIGGAVVVPAGAKVDLSEPFICNYDNQTWIMLGVTQNNGFVHGRPGINIIGNPVINPDEFGTRSPFFGVLDVYGQDKANHQWRVFNVGGAAYISGNTYRGQVAVATINIYNEYCGISACHSHGDGGVIGFTRTENATVETASPTPTLTSGGSGYTDGRWIAPLTGGSGTGALIAFDVESGSVTDFMVIQGGKNYAASDVLSFTNSECINDSQGTMPAGSGFSITVNAVQEVNKSWFNENFITYGTNRGWYGGISSFGSYNYITADIYLEGVWTRTTPVVEVDEGVDVTIEKHSILVNQGVGETTHRLTQLVSMPNASGTKVLSGRSGNPYSTSENPHELFDFGSKSSVSFDMFTDAASTRGKMWQPFTPTVDVDTTDMVVTMDTNATYGRFRDEHGSIEWEALLVFDTNAYTDTSGTILFDLADIGRTPDGTRDRWSVNIGEVDEFEWESGTSHVFGYIVSNQTTVRLYQSRVGFAENAVGIPEIPASNTIRLALSGRFEY